MGIAELAQAFSAVQAFAWGKLEAARPASERIEACLQLAALLDQLARAGRGMADRLAMRFFSHVDRPGQATFAA